MRKPNEIILKVQNYPYQLDRLDKWIADILNIYGSPYQDGTENKTFFSRNKIKNLIISGNVLIDDLEKKNPSFKLKKGNVVKIVFPKIANSDILPENIPLDIVYEDEFLIIINKKSNFVVHPSPGHKKGTLVNAILHHCKGKLSGIGGIERPGIVHRLDKDTSGLIIVAKDELTHIRLSELFKNHKIKRLYDALVWNIPNKKGFVDKPIGRSKFNRKKMSINSNGKKAITHWKLIKVFSNLVSLINCKLETGRTHQIRVHMSSIGNSLIGDSTYFSYLPNEKFLNQKQKSIFKLCKNFNRQALHSSYLDFIHPITHKHLIFKIDLPQDIKLLIKSIS